MRLIALVAENAISERPGPFANGTLLIVRSTRMLYYWDGGPSGIWLPVRLPNG